MSESKLDQWPIIQIGLEDSLETWMKSFIIDRKVPNLSPGMIGFYKDKLKLFAAFCEAQVITNIQQISPVIIRKYLAYPEEKDHNTGEIHAAYRVLKTFLCWQEEETEPEGWKNPIQKVKSPKLSTEPIQPVEISTVER